MSVAGMSQGQKSCLIPKPKNSDRIFLVFGLLLTFLRETSMIIHKRNWLCKAPDTSCISKIHSLGEQIYFELSDCQAWNFNQKISITEDNLTLVDVFAGRFEGMDPDVSSKTIMAIASLFYKSDKSYLKAIDSWVLGKKFLIPWCGTYSKALIDLLLWFNVEPGAIKVIISKESMVTINSLWDPMVIVSNPEELTESEKLALNNERLGEDFPVVFRPQPIFSILAAYVVGREIFFQEDLRGYKRLMAPCRDGSFVAGLAAAADQNSLETKPKVIGCVSSDDIPRALISGRTHREGSSRFCDRAVRIASSLSDTFIVPPKEDIYSATITHKLPPDSPVAIAIAANKFLISQEGCQSTLETALIIRPSI